MNQNKEITISGFFKVLRKYLILILAVTLIFGAIGAAYTLVFGRTTYQAEARFYIPNFSGKDEYVSDQLLSASESLAEVCADLVRENKVVKEFAKDVDASDYFGVGEVKAVQRLTSMISSRTTGKGYMSVSVKSEDKEFAFRVIKSIQEKFPDIASEIVSTGKGESTYRTKLHIVKEVSTIDEISSSHTSLSKMFIVFAFSGFVLSFAAAFIMYMTDTKLHDVATIKEKFTEPVLSQIPGWYTEEDRKALRKSFKKILPSDISKMNRTYHEKLIGHKTPFAVNESFNTLRTNLCYATADDKCPVFAVTSDFSATGKSFISANIAISMATLGKKTLLVECDMRCPDLNKIFATNVGVGLSDILSGNVEHDADGVTASAYDKLDIIYSGVIPPNPAELLGSAKMRTMIETWRENYDYVILDMPPEIEVSDAGILASLVSGYIVVARQNYSDVNAISDVVNSLRAVNGHIIGYVVNAVDLKMGGSVGKKYGEYGKYSRYSRYAKYSKYSVYQREYERRDSQEGKK